MRTLARLAQEAIEVQDACNLSGLVHGWSRSISELREHLPGVGTDAINQHPINQLWASKVIDLTRGESFEAFSKAYDACKTMSNQ